MHMWWVGVGGTPFVVLCHPCVLPVLSNTLWTGSCQRVSCNGVANASAGVSHSIVSQHSVLPTVGNVVDDVVLLMGYVAPGATVPG